MFIFQGDLFEQDDTCASAKSLILGRCTHCHCARPPWVLSPTPMVLYLFAFTADLFEYVPVLSNVCSNQINDQMTHHPRSHTRSFPPLSP
jgi:hypothetical protein